MKRRGFLSAIAALLASAKLPAEPAHYWTVTGTPNQDFPPPSEASRAKFAERELWVDGFVTVLVAFSETDPPSFPTRWFLVDPSDGSLVAIDRSSPLAQWQ